MAIHVTARLAVNYPGQTNGMAKRNGGDATRLASVLPHSVCASIRRVCGWFRPWPPALGANNASTHQDLSVDILIVLVIGWGDHWLSLTRSLMCVFLCANTGPRECVWSYILAPTSREEGFVLGHWYGTQSGLSLHACVSPAWPHPLGFGANRPTEQRKDKASRSVWIGLPGKLCCQQIVHSCMKTAQCFQFV